MTTEETIVYRRYEWHKPMKDEPGAYHCVPCNSIARALNDDYECHSCRDWSGCHDNCGTYAVQCTKCGTVRQFREPRFD